MIKRDNDRPRLFVLDTNVLMHDPASLALFHEPDIYLPMAVAKLIVSSMDSWVAPIKEKIAVGLLPTPLIKNSRSHTTAANGRILFQVAPLGLDLT